MKKINPEVRRLAELAKVRLTIEDADSRDGRGIYFYTRGVIDRPDGCALTTAEARAWLYGYLACQQHHHKE